MGDFFRGLFSRWLLGIGVLTQTLQPLKLLLPPIDWAHSMLYLLLADGPGDRWACFRKKAGREESPDTVVFALAAVGENPWRGAGETIRATRLVTPGGRFFRAVRASEARFSATESATENKPPVRCASVAIWRKTFRRPESSPRKRIAEGDAAR